MSGALIMLLALGIDSAIGWPASIYARIGHPVTWIGAVITRLDRALNVDDAPDLARRVAGVATALIVIGTATGIGWAAARLLPGDAANILMSSVLGAVLAWPLIALRSLYDHVAAVAQALSAGDLAAARAAVAMIVGRDPAHLDAAGVARAAIESLAENASDGIVAPVFWGAIFGLPGIAAYKAVNTLDSMIGHRTPRHEAFGWASARIDDLANLIPARLTALLLAIVSSRPAVAIETVWRDAGHHRSPNAGWPEAAMAGALGIRLSGPRHYNGRIADEPWVNSGATDPAALDLHLALALYIRAMLVLAAGLAIVAALWACVRACL